MSNTIDCRSKEGVTIGLIDSILAAACVLQERDLDESRAVQNALMDLADSKELKKLQELGRELGTLASFEAIGD